MKNIKPKVQSKRQTEQALQSMIKWGLFDKIYNSTIVYNCFTEWTVKYFHGYSTSCYVLCSTRMWFTVSGTKTTS